MTTNTSSAAQAAWPLERETTDTQPTNYRRDKSVRHITWVWWTPHFFVVKGKKMNYHDVYVHRGQNVNQLPPGVTERDWARWGNQKRLVKSDYPANPMFNVEPKGPPAASAAPLAWVNKMTLGAPSTNMPSGTGNGGLPTTTSQATSQPTVVAAASAPVLPVPPPPQQASAAPNVVPAVAPVTTSTSPMDFVLTGAPVSLAPPQPQVGMAPNPLPPVPQTIRQDPTQRPEVINFLQQWVLSTTGGNQRVTHSTNPEEASALRKDWNTVVHHVYWPFEYLCLYFPDYNEAVEFQTDEEMWEDAPRDEGGDVIMGRMCDVPWARCCQYRLAPGGYCD
ncbi:hypothetical protein TWF730_005458 [Orbilia blumenaviensis]|uniref:Uncharacterized protein n=1 Tax=Orbilia blumenaviensis TaxID=1796055 RepID=A0AAV9VIN8_9PEZI